MTEFERDSTVVSGQISGNLSAWRDLYDFRHELGSLDNLFLQKVEAMMATMKHFLDTGHVDGDFIK